MNCDPGNNMSNNKTDIKTDIKTMDREQMGQLIRFKSHSLELAVSFDHTEKERKRNAEDDFHLLQALLDEWQRRGYQWGPDKTWAQERLEIFQQWLQSGRKQIKHTSAPQPAQNKSIREDFYKIVKNRRSIRFWQNKPVPREIINRIIEAATYAPSAFNRMTWRFCVVENQPDRIVDGDISNQSMLEKAPVRIYIAVDQRLYEEKHAPALDAGLALQNLLLAAHAEGLGACLIYQCEIADQERLKDFLQLPGYYNIFAVVTAGYPAEIPSAPARVEINEITSFTRAKDGMETFLI